MLDVTLAKDNAAKCQACARSLDGLLQVSLEVGPEKPRIPAAQLCVHCAVKLAAMIVALCK